MLTPETLSRHELVGLHVEVVESTDPSRVGIEGRVVDETMRTLLVEQANAKRSPDERAVTSEPRASGRSTDRTSGESGVSGGSRDSGSPDSATPNARGETEGVSGTRRVPKVGTTFEFRLTDEPAAAPKAVGTASKPASGEPNSATQTTGDGAAYVTVDGVVLLSRPALRTEKGVDSQWR